MLITAIGNNFGAGPITFKAYSTADMLVLNGKVEVSGATPDFLAAGELEIYLPELPMHKSAETAVFMVMTRSGGLPFATLASARIRNHGTLCIEKVPLYRYYANFTLVFACAFVPKGEVGPFTFEGSTAVTVSSGDASLKVADSICVVHEGWVSLFLQFEVLNAPEATDPFGFTVEGLPEDIAAEVPVVVPGGSGYDGSVVAMARVQGPDFRVDAPSYDAGRSRSGKFLKAFFVRGGDKG